MSDHPMLQSIGLREWSPRVVSTLRSACGICRILNRKTQEMSFDGARCAFGSSVQPFSRARRRRAGSEEWVRHRCWPRLREGKVPRTSTRARRPGSTAAVLALASFPALQDSPDRTQR